MFGRKNVRINQVSSGGDYSRQTQIGTEVFWMPCRNAFLI